MASSGGKAGIGGYAVAHRQAPAATAMPESMFNKTNKTRRSGGFRKKY
ncbi:hypothetical protein [Pseudomonas oligotrophica]|nr:hypothetical protein [Pseudomonas oligotrophica]MCF7200804.1 hypothetical protein [Pseudomonas oligotrophica]